MISTMQSAIFNPKLDGTSDALGMDETIYDQESGLFASELEAASNQIDYKKERKNASFEELNSGSNKTSNTDDDKKLATPALNKEKSSSLAETSLKSDRYSFYPMKGDVSAQSVQASNSDDDGNVQLDDDALEKDSPNRLDFLAFLNASVSTDTRVKKVKQDPFETPPIVIKDPIEDDVYDLASEPSFSEDTKFNSELVNSQENIPAPLSSFSLDVTNNEQEELSTSSEEKKLSAGEVQSSEMNKTTSRVLKQSEVRLSEESTTQVELTYKDIKSSLQPRAENSDPTRPIKTSDDKVEKLAEINTRTKDKNADSRENKVMLTNKGTQAEPRAFNTNIESNVSSIEKAKSTHEVESKIVLNATQGEAPIKTAEPSNETKTAEPSNETSVNRAYSELDAAKSKLASAILQQLNEKQTTDNKVTNNAQSDKGIGVAVKNLESEINQLSKEGRKALKLNLEEKLAQGALTPAEKKVMESVLKALQIDESKVVTLNSAEFVRSDNDVEKRTVFVDKQEGLSRNSAAEPSAVRDVDVKSAVKASDSKNIQNTSRPSDNQTLMTFKAVGASELDDRSATSQTQLSSVAKSENGVFKGSVPELNSARVEVQSIDKVEPRSNSMAEEPASLAKVVSATEMPSSLAIKTENQQVVVNENDKEELKPDLLLNEEELTQERSAIDATSSSQQQAKTADITAGLQRIMQTVANLAQANTQFDNAVTTQVFQQLEQVQHQHTAAQQMQKVVMDPAMLEAINIARHDAVKELQNRVSMMLNLNNKEAEIRLDPPELGSLQIRIRTDAETAQVNFVVQNQQAKELLEQSLPKLREMLAEQGINLGESNIEQGFAGQQNQDSDPNRSKGTSVITEQSEVTVSENSRTTEKTSSSAIDYYA